MPAAPKLMSSIVIVHVLIELLLLLTVELAWLWVACAALLRACLLSLRGAGWKRIRLKQSNWLSAVAWNLARLLA